MEKSLFQFTSYDESKQREVLVTESQPDYTDEDISMAHRSGFEQGYIKGREDGVQEGHTKAVNEVDQEIRLQLKAMVEKLSQIVTEQSIQSNYLQDNTLILCQAIFRKILPQYMEANANNEMVNKLKLIVSKLRHKQPVTIRVHPEREVFLKENLQMLFPNIFENVSIETLETLHPFDFEINWDQGGSRWSMDETIQKIEAIMFLNSNNNEVTP